MSETDIKREIMDWLTVQTEKGHLIYWPVHLGAVKVGGARKRNPMRGHPDIAGVLMDVGPFSGMYFAIEVKKPGQGFSQEQMDWALKLQKAGAVYMAVTSLQEVIDCFGFSE